MRPFVVLALAAVACDAPQEPKRARLRGWFVESPNAAPPAELELRRPYEHLNARTDWTVVPERELEGRLAAALADGRGPDLLGANVYPTRQLVRDQDALKTVRTVSARAREGIPWVSWMGRGEHAAELREDLLSAPPCPDSPPRFRLRDPDVAVLSVRAASALVRGDAAELSVSWDPEALPAPVLREAPVRIVHVKACEARGDAHLAWVPVLVTFEARTVLGTQGVLTVWRRTSSGGPWRLLVATSDPTAVSTGFDREPSILRHLGEPRADLVAGARATLVRPVDGETPKPPSGQRFGWFVFSDPGVPAGAHVVEFRNDFGTRLFWPGHSDPQLAEQPVVSAGGLWSVGEEWQWRVWTPQPDGGMTFSEVRRFVH